MYCIVLEPDSVAAVCTGDLLQCALDNIAAVCTEDVMAAAVCVHWRFAAVCTE